MGLLACNGRAFPATELIEHGGPTAPVRIFASVREERRNLLPVPLGRAPFQGEGLSHGRTRYGQRHGLFACADRHIGVNGPAVQAKDRVLQEDIEVSPPQELLGDRPARDLVDLRASRYL